LTTLVGRRLQPVDGLLPFGGDSTQWKPGDYCGPIKGYTGDLEACMYLLPVAKPGDRLHHVCFPPHTYRECADGSLEIRNSILHKGYITEDDQNGEWHGFLNEGHSWSW
jgi:hypothetical protein